MLAANKLGIMTMQAQFLIKCVRNFLIFHLSKEENLSKDRFIGVCSCTTVSFLRERLVYHVLSYAMGIGFRFVRLIWTMKRRIVGYDVVKSIAMFFVVMLHYSFYTRFYSSSLVGTSVTVLCVVCVPLFFAVNGALLLPRPMDEAKHYRKTLNIIIVVTIWRLLAAAFFVFIDSSHPVTVKNLFIFLLGGGFGDYPTGYFWFMNALIAVYLVLPVMKMVFDSERKTVFKALLAVLVGFTVGKDSLRLVLQMVGSAVNHDFASILNSLNEFYIFGSYGYVLLYFLVGGMVGRYSKQWQQNDSDVNHHPVFGISSGKACIGILACYVLTLLIQRYQHVAYGTNLTVENGYWLLPTFIATVLILLVLGRARIQGFWAKAFQVIGMNTFGVYMLHLAGLVFAVCLVISVLLRKIPYIGRLFAL